MIYCRPRKMYIVWTRQVRRRGRWYRNFKATSSFSQARYWAKKLSPKHRKIDRIDRGQAPFVLECSWS